MAAPVPTYDLMLLLDAQLEDTQRTKILADARAMVEAQGTVVSDNEYGRRTMAYEIDHAPEVDYHLLQFKGPAALLEQLSRTLRITDGITRFRIIKVRKDAPAPPDLRQGAQVVTETADADSDAVAEPAAG
jgi:small subunit ribosomal protein S6